MIIDCHTHLFPDRIAPKVLEANLTDLNLAYYGTGTRDGLLRYMDEAAIDYCTLLGVAPSARFIRSTNDHLLGLNHPRLIVFGTVTPDYEDWRGELHRLKEGGAKGIKINSLLQEIVPDDTTMYPIYETLIEEGMVIYFHAGKGEGTKSQGEVRATPERLRKVHDLFPKLRIILAHFGGYLMLDEVRKHLIGQDVVFDTSYCPSLKDLPMDEVTKLIRDHGPSRFVFGTDWPWARQGAGEGWEHDFIRSLPFDNEEKEMILGGNAYRLFSL